MSDVSSMPPAVTTGQCAGAKAGGDCGCGCGGAGKSASVLDSIPAWAWVLLVVVLVVFLADDDRLGRLFGGTAGRKRVAA